MVLPEQLSAADRQWSARVRQLTTRPGPLRWTAILLAHSGDSPLWVGGALLVLWRGPTAWRPEAGLDLIGIVVTAAVVQLIKFVVRRPRPAGEWGEVYRRVDPHSFPSGHAARAALLAVVALALGPGWWAAILIIWAPLVGLARVAMGVHYFSDVVAGMACGAACGVVTLTLPLS